MARDSRQFWDRAAEKYAASKIADQDGYERSLTRVRELLGPGDRVHEIGCGTGTTALKLADSLGHIEATDISGEMIRIAEAKAEAAGVGNVSFSRRVVSDLDPAETPFDAVLAFNVLHLVDDIDADLARLRQIVRPGGLFISKTPSLGEMNPLIRWVMIPLMQAVGKAPHVASLTERTLVAAVERAGFTIEAVEDHASKGKFKRPFIIARA